jgi:hypothetical protein
MSETIEEERGRKEPMLEGVEKDDELVVPKELQEYFDRLASEKGENAAAEAALARAEQEAAAQADRSMHLTDASEETINGALSRIGADLSAGKDAGPAIEDVKKEMTRLRAEERAALAALRAELPPPPSAAAPKEGEKPATNPADAWSMPERAAVAAYLDALDETDRAHAALAKAKRELKKITNEETDEWEIKADEVTALDKAWRDKKAEAKSREAALGAAGGQMVGLDAGRKAGREELRKNLAEAGEIKRTEGTEGTKGAEGTEEPKGPDEPEEKEVPVIDGTTAGRREEPEEPEGPKEPEEKDVPVSVIGGPTAGRLEEAEVAAPEVVSSAPAEVAPAEVEEPPAVDAGPRAIASLEGDANAPQSPQEIDTAYRDASGSMDQALALAARTDSEGLDGLLASPQEMNSWLPADSPLRLPENERRSLTPEQAVRAQVDAYGVMLRAMAELDLSAPAADGQAEKNPAALRAAADLFEAAARSADRLPAAAHGALLDAMRGAASRVQDAHMLSDGTLKTWVERTQREAIKSLRDRADEIERMSNDAEKKPAAREHLERLWESLEESGNAEFAAAEEVDERLQAMGARLEERSWQNYEVQNLCRSLLAARSMLDQWKDDWTQTLGTINAGREDDGLSREDVEQLLVDASKRAEETESAARSVVAYINETLDTARQLAYRDGRNDPDNSVTFFADEIDQRVNSISAGVTRKRDQIFEAIASLNAE